MIKILYQIIALMVLGFACSYSQDDTLSSERDKMIIYELQDYRYNFFRGDTLRYRVETFDSILINYDKPIEKTRLENIEITCDSVTKDRKFLLSFRLLNFISDEVYAGTEKSRRISSPWTKRQTFLWIDSLGNRISSYPDDSLKFAMSPAGAFAPTLIFPFKETYRYINESWLVNSQDTLCENGVPCAVVKQSSLFRARNPLDTLNYECGRFSFIKTGIGHINVITNENRIRTESTLTGSGIISISKKHWIPVHYFTNLEQKLLIFYPDKDEIPGQHYTSMDWTLEEFIPGPSRFGDQKSSKKTKSKK